MRHLAKLERGSINCGVQKYFRQISEEKGNENLTQRGQNEGDPTDRNQTMSEKHYVNENNCFVLRAAYFLSILVFFRVPLCKLILFTDLNMYICTHACTHISMFV